MNVSSRIIRVVMLLQVHHAVFPVSSILFLLLFHRNDYSCVISISLLIVSYPLTHCFSCIPFLPIILLADTCIQVKSSKTCLAPASGSRFLAPQYWGTRKGSNPLPSPSVSKPKGGPKLKGSEVKAQWWKNL